MDAKTFVIPTPNWQRKTFTLRLIILTDDGTKREKYRTRKLWEDEFCRAYFGDDDFWLEKIKNGELQRLR